MKKIVVLSGAGISAESGLKTFRDANGLWEGHDVMAVASPQGWEADQDLVLDFYNQRRRQLLTVAPNQGHYGLVELENNFDVTIITQNVDDLHERAGSSKVIHLHGELLKSRSINDVDTHYECKEDIKTGDRAIDGSQLRPHIVWFGEMVPMLELAAEEVAKANIVIIVGTSLQVYPAAGLVSFAPFGSKIFYVDPKPNISFELSQRKNIEIVGMVASIGIPFLCNKLMKE